MIEIYRDEPGVDGRLTERQILNAIAWKKGKNLDINRQKLYYFGRNPEILNSEHKHKIPAPFGRKLLKTVTGFMFKEGSITYTFPDNEESLKDYITDIFSCNDEETENTRLAKDQSCFGTAYECLYIDNEDAHIQFRRMPVENVVTIYGHTVDSDLVAAINFYTVGRENRLEIVEVYYKDKIFHYINDGKLQLQKEVLHQFGEVPIVEYRNNEEGMGDIEPIIKLIDAHDDNLSTAIDEDDKFADAILMLINTRLSDEAIKNLKDSRILDDMETGAEAKYLTKPETFQGREILRSTIEKLIHSLSGIPKLDDQGALAAESGEAMKYLYATFEMVVAGEKQSEFTNGLQRRLRLIFNFASWLGLKNCGNNGIKIKWARNLPSESTTIIDNTVKIADRISHKTFLEQMLKADIIDDIDKEIEREKNEQAAVMTEALEDSYELE